MRGGEFEWLFVVVVVAALVAGCVVVSVAVGVVAAVQ